MERMKVCARCELNLPESDFSSDRSRKDGKNKYCRTCISVRMREKRQDPAYVKREIERVRQYQETNRESHLAAKRKVGRRRRSGGPARVPRYLAEIPANS